MTRLLLFDGKIFKIVNIGDDIEQYHELLECDYFDIARRKVGDKYYDIFCDDCGLFKEDNFVSAVSSKGEMMLVGKLIFANHDAEGNTTSLSDDDINNIMSNMAKAYPASGGSPITVVVCDY